MSNTAWKEKEAQEDGSCGLDLKRKKGQTEKHDTTRFL